MRRDRSSLVIAGVTVAALWLLAGCRSAPAPVLPTATPVPTQAISTATVTPLPPPTVTAYPSPTMRGADGAVPPTVDVSSPATGAPGAPGTSAPVVQATQAPTLTPSITPSPAPTLTPTVSFINLPSGVSLGGAIYFSDFEAGWPSTNDPTAKIAIKNGQYVFEVGPYDGRYFNTTLIKQANLYVQVEVTPDTCPQKAGYGLMFHFVDANNYYLLTVFCDNTYTAIAKVAGSVMALNYGSLPSGLDAKQNGVLHLGVLARGTSYTLFLEGKSIGSFDDSQFPQGDVAIYAVSQGNKVLKVAFDNLKVWSVQ